MTVVVEELMVVVVVGLVVLAAGIALVVVTVVGAGVSCSFLMAVVNSTASRSYLCLEDA